MCLVYFMIQRAMKSCIIVSRKIQSATIPLSSIKVMQSQISQKIELSNQWCTLRHIVAWWSHDHMMPGNTSFIISATCITMQYSRPYIVAQCHVIQQGLFERCTRNADKCKHIATYDYFLFLVPKIPAYGQHSALSYVCDSGLLQGCCRTFFKWGFSKKIL